MDFLVLTRYTAAGGLILGAVGFIMRLAKMTSLPVKKDLSRSRGSTGSAILYAFTLGMAPWEKESTRIHWIAYIRGILFHIGVFTSLAVLLGSLWLDHLPEILRWLALAVTGVGAAACYAGIWMRLSEPDLRTISVPDDYFSIILVGLFITTAFGVLLTPVLLPVFYIVSTVMFIYIPFSKIKHCAYFFSSKFFFGWNFGHRGTLPHKHGQYAE